MDAGLAIAQALVAEGVTRVYGMPGGHVLPIYDGIARTDGISSILVRHEFHAAAMASAEAQLTGQPGVVLVTAGPGVTNTLTAVAEAYVGATPMVVLGGRGSTASVLRGASQEVPTERIFEPVTKWTLRVDRADLLREAVRQAFQVARSGRPGPVLLDLPRDVLTQEVDDSLYAPTQLASRVSADAATARRVAGMLSGARRPIVVAGGGAARSRCAVALEQLLSAVRAPLLTTLSGRGSVPERGPWVAGGLGAHRNAFSKRALAEADVVLVLGARFEEMETNGQPGALPQSRATVVQVDLEASEFGRGTRADIGVVADIGVFVEQILEHIDPAQVSSTWQAADVAEGVASVEAELAGGAGSTERPLHPSRVVSAAVEVFPESTVLGFDVGALAQHIAGAFPATRLAADGASITPSSFYGMGFVAAALPAARLVHPDRPALAFVGDGSFQMVMNVVPTAAQYRLGVTWCVLNDDALGSIWDLQHHQYGNRIIDTAFDFQPSLAGIARASGAYGERVEEPDAVVPAFERALAANLEGTPAVLDFSVARVRLAQTREHYYLTYPQED